MTYLLFTSDGRMLRHETTGVATLQQLQAWVGGDIEPVYRMDPMDGDVIYLVNETGMVDGLPRNRIFPDLFGTVVVCRVLGEDCIGVSNHDIERYRMFHRKMLELLGARH